VLRIEVLINYGGIYLDNDVYVVQSLEKFLKFEMVVSWDEPQVNRSIGI
jgi:mannosyltransferase OCH1-like enzyme